MDWSNRLRLAVSLVICVGLGGALSGCDEPYQYEERTEQPGPGERVPEGLLDNWADIDADDDQLLTRDEYATALREDRFFSEWDQNEDHHLSQSEFAAGIFDTWDGNNDGMVTTAQYAGAVDAWFEDTQVGEFSSLDANGDGRLARAEFVQKANLQPVLASLDSDSDGNLAQNEYGEGLFLMNDFNADGVIEQQEMLF